MRLQDIIKKYVTEWPEESNRKLATLILESENSVEIKHRTLRRKISEYRSAATNPQHRMHHVSKTHSKGNQEIVYRGPESITSLEQAIEFFEIDTNKWQVQSWTANSWDTGNNTNYQVKLKLEPISSITSFSIDELKEKYNKAVKTITPRKVKGTNTGVLILADFHVGAKVKDLNITPDFSYDILVDRLEQTARHINKCQYEKVELVLLGDFIESFTGLNHTNTWQELEYGGFGSNVVILAYQMIRNFLDKVHNLSSITIVSGNHDRTSIKTELDPKGGVAQLLAFMLDQSSTSIDVVWDPMLVSKEIDGMQYVLTHNHLGVSKNDMAKLFWEYGSQGKYNLLIGGHWHSRRGKRTYRQVDEIYWDQANYRAISVAPLFTGNFYSESSGWTSSSGITIIENNGAGKPNVYDITLI